MEIDSGNVFHESDSAKLGESCNFSVNSALEALSIADCFLQIWAESFQHSWFKFKVDHLQTQPYCYFHFLMLDCQQSDHLKTTIEMWIKTCKKHNFH